jgi:hypothetical protein
MEVMIGRVELIDREYSIALASFAGFIGTSPR